MASSEFNLATKLALSPLSGQWLQDKLQTSLKSAATLTEIECRPIGGELGFMSDIFVAKLTWLGGDGGELPSSVVVKVPSDKNAIKHFAKLAEGSAAMRAELEKPGNAPSDMTPFLYHMNDIEMMTMRRLNSNKSLLVPRIFGGQKGDVEKGIPAVLIMEDLTEGTTLQDFLQGCSLPQIMSLVDNLAAVHVESLSYPDGWQASYFNEEQNESMLGFLDMMRTVAPQCAVIDPSLKELVDRVMPHFTVDRIVESATSFMTVGLPPMLVHGDLWSSNILWRTTAEGKEAGEEVASIIDWQSANAGNALVDIARFLWSSVEGDLRREHLSAILDRYYETSRKLYTASNEGKPLPFDRATVTKAYEASLPFVMMFALFGFPLWCGIEAIVGKEGEPKHKENVKRLMRRAGMLMEDYLTVFDGK